MSKYVVLKIADVHEVWSEGGTVGELLEREIHDAWVIRKQDAHAAPTAFAYANAVQTTLEVLESVKAGDITDDVFEHLKSIRDAAFEYATSASATTTRLPD